MLREVIAGSGRQMVRIEKPGVSDSEGLDCSRTDLEDGMAAFRAGIRAALADPQRLYLFGGSVGGALTLVLAHEFPCVASSSPAASRARGSSTCSTSSVAASRFPARRPRKSTPR